MGYFATNEDGQTSNGSSVGVDIEVETNVTGF